MSQFFSKEALRPGFATSLFLFCGLIGCSGTTVNREPTYAELVTIYNGELQTLDRLEGKREELIAKHKAALGPSTEDTAKALDALLSSAKEAGKQLNLNGVSDPNELLDRAAEHAEKAQGLTSGILEAVGSAAEPTEEQLQKQAKQTEQFERDLAVLDKKIAEQQARVDRARKARDAAPK